VGEGVELEGGRPEVGVLVEEVDGERGAAPEAWTVQDET
jgi:hypothetical protein